MGSESQWIKTGVEAAKALGITERRLYAMVKSSPWWEPRFKSDQGWDVGAISQAQRAFHADGPSGHGGNEWTQRSQAAKAKIAELQLQEKELELDKVRANILPRQVYEQFHADLFAILKRAADEIPKRLLRKAPKAARSVCWNANGNSPVQREFEKLLQDVGEWRTRDPETESG